MVLSIYGLCGSSSVPEVNLAYIRPSFAKLLKKAIDKDLIIKVYFGFMMYVSGSSEAVSTSSDWVTPLMSDHPVQMVPGAPRLPGAPMLVPLVPGIPPFMPPRPVVPPTVPPGAPPVPMDLRVDLEQMFASDLWDSSSMMQTPPLMMPPAPAPLR